MEQEGITECILIKSENNCEIHTETFKIETKNDDLNQSKEYQLKEVAEDATVYSTKSCRNYEFYNSISSSREASSEKDFGNISNLANSSEKYEIKNVGPTESDWFDSFEMDNNKKLSGDMKIESNFIFEEVIIKVEDQDHSENAIRRTSGGSEKEIKTGNEIEMFYEEMKPIKSEPTTEFEQCPSDSTMQCLKSAESYGLETQVEHTDEKSSQCHIKKDQRFHSEKKFECEVCSKSFFEAIELKIHRVIHAGEKPFKCEICSKSFSYACYMKKHQRMHTGEKPYKCKVCSKSFPYASSLWSHQSIHSVEKPFECDVCLKAFGKSFQLKVHKIVHTTGENPFECKICSKTFNRKFGLQQHMIVHTGEKSFKCQVCSKSYSYKSNLNAHLRSHDDEQQVKCNVCSQSFPYASYLKIHQRIHTGEKPFKCEVCSKAFARSSDLKIHQLVHSVEKPFKCEFCSKSYPRKYKLQQHLINHNRENLSAELV